jgi:DNA-binding response OmpR family regulator
MHHVLIIDDDESVREALKDFLEEKEFEVTRTA